MSKSRTIDISNRRAAFEYFFLETYTAGIALTGTEIKSIREGKVNLTDAYCIFQDDEMLVHHLHISPYEKGTYANHNPTRDRKLLLKKRELKRLSAKLKDQGLTIVPTRIFINEKGLAKVDIALAKGKKLYDKRETIKERDLKRQRDSE
ncbi:MAG: SsrA-binding protein SmpB [Runella sp.]